MPWWKEGGENEPQFKWDAEIRYVCCRIYLIIFT